jgi:hypothetical protein
MERVTGSNRQGQLEGLQTPSIDLGRVIDAGSDRLLGASRHRISREITTVLDDAEQTWVIDR